MKRASAFAAAIVAALLLTACSTPRGVVEVAPAPTVTVTATPEPEVVDDEWQRFRDDPKEAFIFASAYEMIWGYPIGNGETADGMVALANDICTVAKSSGWAEVEQALAEVESSDRVVLMSRIYCPEVTG